MHPPPCANARTTLPLFRVQRAHKVGSGAGSPTRSRHFLRRYYALQQRIAQGEVSLQYVQDVDEDMSADFR